MSETKPRGLLKGYQPTPHHRHYKYVLLSAIGITIISLAALAMTFSQGKIPTMGQLKGSMTQEVEQVSRSISQDQSEIKSVDYSASDLEETSLVN